MKGIPFLSKLQGIKLVIKGLDLGAGLEPYKTLLSTSPRGFQILSWSILNGQ